MKLTTQAEVTTFLNDFEAVIDQTAAANGCVLDSFNNEQGRKIFVDQRESRDLLFLMQFYNRVAQMALAGEIDLQIIFDDMLKEKRLSGVNADELDTDLVIFFSNYKLITPAKRIFEQPAKLQASIEELKRELENLGDGSCYQDSVGSLIQLAQCKDGSTVADWSPTALFNDDSLEKMVTDTRKLIAPKFGEKNCFSLEARQRQYQKEAALTGVASATNGVLGALIQVPALAIALAIIPIVFALCLVLPPAGAIALTCTVGLIFIAITSYTAVMLNSVGASLIGKANNQRKMCGTMFSIANAGSDAKRDIEMTALPPARYQTL